MDKSRNSRMLASHKRKGSEPTSESSDSDSDDSSEYYRGRKKFDDIRNSSTSSSSSSVESDEFSSSSYEYTWKEAKTDSSENYEYIWTEAEPIKLLDASKPCIVNLKGTVLPAIKRKNNTVIPLKAVLVILFPNNTPDDLEEGIRKLDIHRFSKFEAEQLTKFVQTLYESGARTITVGKEVYVAGFSTGEAACDFHSLEINYSVILDTLVATPTDALKTGKPSMQKHEALQTRVATSETSTNSLVSEKIESSVTPKKCRGNDNSLNSESNDDICLNRREKVPKNNLEFGKKAYKKYDIIQASEKYQKPNGSVVLEHLFPENDEDEESESDPVLKEKFEVLNMGNSKPKEIGEEEQQEMRLDLGEENGIDTWTSLLLGHKSCTKSTSDIATEVRQLSLKDGIVTQNDANNRNANGNITEIDRQSNVENNKTPAGKHGGSTELHNTVAEESCPDEVDGCQKSDLREILEDLRKKSSTRSISKNIVNASHTCVQTISSSNPFFIVKNVSCNSDAKVNASGLTSVSFTNSEWKVTDLYKCKSSKISTEQISKKFKSGNDNDSLITSQKIRAGKIVQKKTKPKRSSSQTRKQDKRERRGNSSEGKSYRIREKRDAKAVVVNHKVGRKKEIRNRRRSSSSSTDRSRSKSGSTREYDRRRKLSPFQMYGGFGQSNSYYRPHYNSVQITPRFVPNYSKLTFESKPGLYSSLSSSEADFGDEEEVTLKEPREKSKILRRRSSRDNSRHRSRLRNTCSADRRSDYDSDKDSQQEARTRSGRTMSRRRPQYHIRREYSPRHDVKKTIDTRSLSVQEMDAVIPTFSTDINNLVTSIRKQCDQTKWEGSHNYPRLSYGHLVRDTKYYGRRRSHSPSRPRDLTPSTWTFEKCNSLRQRSLSPVFHSRSSSHSKNRMDTLAIGENPIIRDTSIKLNATSSYAHHNLAKPAFTEVERVWIVGEAGSKSIDQLNVTKHYSLLPRTAVTVHNGLGSHRMNCTVSLSNELKLSDCSSFTPVLRQLNPGYSNQRGSGLSVFSFQEQELFKDSSLRKSFNSMRERELLNSSKYQEDEVIIVKGGHEFLNDAAGELWPFISGPISQESSFDDSCDGEVESFMFSRLSRSRRKKDDFNEFQSSITTTEKDTGMAQKIGSLIETSNLLPTTGVDVDLSSKQNYNTELPIQQSSPSSRKCKSGSDLNTCSQNEVLNRTHTGTKVTSTSTCVISENADGTPSIPNNLNRISFGVEVDKDEAIPGSKDGNTPVFAISSDVKDKDVSNKPGPSFDKIVTNNFDNDCSKERVNLPTIEKEVGTLTSSLQSQGIIGSKSKAQILISGKSWKKQLLHKAQSGLTTANFHDDGIKNISRFNEEVLSVSVPSGIVIEKDMQKNDSKVGEHISEHRCETSACHAVESVSIKDSVKSQVPVPHLSCSDEVTECIVKSTPLNGAVTNKCSVESIPSVASSSYDVASVEPCTSSLNSRCADVITANIVEPSILNTRHNAGELMTDVIDLVSTNSSILTTRDGSAQIFNVEQPFSRASCATINGCNDTLSSVLVSAASLPEKSVIANNIPTNATVHFCSDNSEKLTDTVKTVSCSKNEILNFSSVGDLNPNIPIYNTVSMCTETSVIGKNSPTGAIVQISSENTKKLTTALNTVSCLKNKILSSSKVSDSRPNIPIHSTVSICTEGSTTNCDSPLSAVVTEVDLSSTRIFSNVGISSVTIINDPATPVLELKAQPALAERNTFRGPQIKHTNSVIKTIKPLIKIPLISSEQTAAISDKPYFRSARNQKLGNIKRTISAAMPVLDERSGTIQPNLLSTSAEQKTIKSHGGANTTTVSAISSICAISSTLSSNSIVASKDSSLPGNCETFDPVKKNISSEHMRPPVKLVQRREIIENHEGPHEATIVPRVTSPKPLKSILYKPPVSNSLKNKSESKIDLPTSGPDMSATKSPTYHIQTETKSSKDCLPKTTSGMSNKLNSSKKTRNYDKKIIRNDRFSRQSPARGKKRRSGGSRRGRTKRRKRLPSISSDEDIIEELNATTCSFGSLPKPSSPEQDNETSELDTEESDDGLVSFMKVTKDQLQKSVHASESDQQREQNLENKILLQNEKNKKSDGVRPICALFASDSEDSDEEDVLPLSLLARNANTSQTTSKNNNEYGIFDCSNTSVHVDENENIFTKISREIAAESEKNGTDIDPVIHELLYPPFEKPPHILSSGRKTEYCEQVEHNGEINNTRSSSSQNEKLSNTRICVQERNFFQKPLTGDGAKDLESNNSEMGVDVKNVDSSEITVQFDQINKKHSSEHSSGSFDKLSLNSSKEETVPSTEAGKRVISQTYHGKQTSSICSRKSVPVMDLLAQNDPNTVLQKVNQSSLQPILPTPPTSPSSINNDGKPLSVRDVPCSSGHSHALNHTYERREHLKGDRPAKEAGEAPRTVSGTTNSDKLANDTNSTEIDKPQSQKFFMNDNNPALSGNLIETAAELSGVKASTYVTGNSQISTENVQTTEHVTQPQSASESDKKTENIKEPLSTMSCSSIKQFNSLKMPEVESCHGFLEVCMSVHPNRVYAQRRIPYVKTTTFVTESVNSSVADSFMSSSELPRSSFTKARNHLPTSSACATYIRLRDVIALLKMHYEALHSLVIRCDAEIFSPNNYTRKLFDFVYDPVCSRDMIMAKMTMKNVRSLKAQEFLDHMIILDKFLHCMLPKFYYEGLKVISCDVPKYVNVKIFKPITNIDMEVVKIFQKPYEYNSVLRGKDEKIKYYPMEKLKFQSDGAKGRKRVGSSDSASSGKKQKLGMSGLSPQVSSSVTANVSNLSFSTKMPLSATNCVQERFDQRNSFTPAYLNTGSYAQHNSGGTIPRSTDALYSVRISSQSSFRNVDNTCTWFSPPQSHQTFSPMAKPIVNIGSTAYAQATQTFGRVDPIVKMVQATTMPTTRLSQFVELQRFSTANLQAHPSPVFSNMRPTPHLKASSSISENDTAIKIEGCRNQGDKCVGVSMNVSNGSKQHATNNIATSTSSSPDLEFSITSVFSLKDKKAIEITNTEQKEAVQPISTASMLTTKEFLQNASKVLNKSDINGDEGETALVAKLRSRNTLLKSGLFEAGDIMSESTTETDVVNQEPTVSDKPIVSATSGSNDTDTVTRAHGNFLTLDTTNSKVEVITRQGRKKLLEQMVSETDAESVHLSGIVSKLKSRVDEGPKRKKKVGRPTEKKSKIRK